MFTQRPWKINQGMSRLTGGQTDGRELTQFVGMASCSRVNRKKCTRNRQASCRRRSSYFQYTGVVVFLFKCNRQASFTVSAKTFPDMTAWNCHMIVAACSFFNVIFNLLSAMAQSFEHCSRERNVYEDLLLPLSLVGVPPLPRLIWSDLIDVPSKQNKTVYPPLKKIQSCISNTITK